MATRILIDINISLLDVISNRNIRAMFARDWNKCCEISRLKKDT